MKSLWNNFWTITGAIIAILAALFFISFQIIDILVPTANPYIGIWTFMIFPALLVFGLLLIPVGYLLERKKRRIRYPEVESWPRFPQFDMNNSRHLRGLIIFCVGTLMVVPMIGIASYEGYHYTDSTRFCGQVCHTVMNPEYAAYRNSPHARVSCAACHIGPGASWFVKSKLSGVRQVIAVMLGTYSRPIPTPVTNLRPARETCEQCHWPAKFYASQLRTRTHFASDENNTRSEIRVLLNTGGGDSSMGPPSGIHWHMALSRRIEYVAADEKHQVISWIRAIDPSGKETVYRYRAAGTQEMPPQTEWRTFDCMDCHNRPTHIIMPPDRAVNISIETNRIDRSMPFIKKVAVEALTLPYETDDEADSGIDQYIRDFYRNGKPEAGISEQTLVQAIREVQAIYHRNFFPLMRVDWRAYPDNIGHMMFEGCFRCHDGEHTDSEGVAVSMDCDSCHQFLEPAGDHAPETFIQGVPEHPVKLPGDHSKFKCSKCHTGGRAPETSCAGCHVLQSRFHQGKDINVPGLSDTPPSWMGDLDCESCHDMSNPQTTENIAAQCEVCHEQGYGDMIRIWKDDAAAGRARATEAIEALEKETAGSPRAEGELRALVDQMREALANVDKAGAQHNLDYANAVYEQIVNLAATGGQKPAAKK